MELWKSESEKFKKVESTNSKAGKLAVRWRNTDTKQFWMSCTVPNQVKVYNSLAMHLVALEGKNSDETLKHNSDFSVWGTPNARQEKQIRDSAQSSFLVCIQEVPEQCKSHWEQTPGSATSMLFVEPHSGMAGERAVPGWHWGKPFWNASPLVPCSESQIPHFCKVKAL